MPRPSVTWSPNRRDIVSVANCRITLAFLRIFREVRVGVAEPSYDDIARPLWPAMRLERKALQLALISSRSTMGSRSGARRKSTRHSDDDPESGPPTWLAGLTNPCTALPLEAPDDDALRYLGAALVRDMPAFRALFDAVEQRLERRARQKLPIDRNIEWLTTLLALAPLEQQFLSLSSALELGTIERDNFTQVGNTVRRARALRAIFRCPDEQAISALVSRHGALPNSGLLRMPERADSDLEDLLKLSKLGSLLTTHVFGSIDEMAERVLKPLPAPEDVLGWPHLKERTILLEKTLQNALHLGEFGINILVYGAPGTGKTQYARALIRQAGALGFGIDDTDDQQRPASRDERLGSLRLSEIFAPLGRSVLVLDEAEDIFQSDYTSPLGRLMGEREASKSWMNQRLEGNRVPVIWISNQIGHIDPAYLRRFTYCLEFPVPPRDQRREIARRHLGAVGASEKLIDQAASHATLPAALLASAARFVALSKPAPDLVDAAARQMLADHLKAMGQPFRPTVVDSGTRFDLGYLNAVGSVQPASMIAGLAKLGRGSVLLSGLPGTGKTQLAAQIAREMGRDLVYRTAADINSKWYGESERNVAALFTECDPRAEVLFLDEADTLLADRARTGHRADRAVTSEFLRRLEAFEGVFVCATNHPDAFDSALMRRFVFRLDLQALTPLQRSALLRECLQAEGAAEHADERGPSPAQLARLQRMDHLTPGDFANVARRFRALGLASTAAAWIEELDAEHRTKPAAARSAMGFV